VRKKKGGGKFGQVEPVENKGGGTLAVNVGGKNRDKAEKGQKARKLSPWEKEGAEGGGGRGL